MLRFVERKCIQRLGKQTQHFIGWEFWEILMCSRTACSTSQDSLFSTSFTGYPSIETFYEVQLQQLLLHRRHNFHKWCRNSWLAGSWSGRYYPQERRGHQSHLSGGTKACFLFLFIYIASLFFFLFPLPRPPSLMFIKDSVGFSKVPYYIKKKTSSDKKIRMSPLMEDFMCVCVLVFVMLFFFFSFNPLLTTNPGKCILSADDD